jgi:hypothetical protein
MISRFAYLFIFVVVLCSTSCNRGPDIQNYYVFDQFGDSSVSINVMDDLILNVPYEITDFDSVCLLFPSNGKELRFKPNKYYDFVIESRSIDSLFKQNDSVQVLFRRKNKIIFKPFLIKEIDTIGSSGMIKLC